jgi:hypothetical protein
MTRERLPQVAFGSFVLGLLLLFLVEAGIARAVAVVLIFVGIALGVTATASPEFLERDDER